MNENEQKVDEEYDDAWQMNAEIVRMSQEPSVVLQRRQVEEQVEGEEGKQWNRRTQASCALHVHYQT